VESGEKAVHDPARHDFYAAKRGDGALYVPLRLDGAN
jgi:hypothetical protein